MDSQGILEIFGKEIISGSPREENIRRDDIQQNERMGVVASLDHG
ncbi:8600_t:CDS:2 [Rhizophagus irregularis]|nr:8600_t:CDS:2 [Rhizophagus irregularis]